MVEALLIDAAFVGPILLMGILCDHLTDTGECANLLDDDPRQPPFEDQ
jgi:hypothetical protein